MVSVWLLFGFSSVSSFGGLPPFFPFSYLLLLASICGTIDGSLCILGDSLSDTQYAKSGKWLSAFNAIITATEVRNYARSGASWSHTASTVYNITDGGGNWDAKNVIWNQVNRLINDVQNNGKAIPKVIIAFASTNDAMILM